MNRNPGIFCLGLMLLGPAAFSQNLAQFVSAAGSVHWFNPAGAASKPCKQWPVRLIPLDSSGQRGAALELKTDSYGQYAFYGLPEGAYELEIPRGFGRFFRKKVALPGTMEPIVLPPRLPALPDTNANPIQVGSDYEAQGPGRYRFRLWARIPKEWKPLVKKVRYFMNHPSFTDKYLIGQDPSRDFMAEYLGWGCLENVAVEVVFANDVWNLEFPFCADLKGKAQARKKSGPAVK